MTGPSPSLEHMARWTRLIAEARSHAEALTAYQAGGRQGPVPLADKLAIARRACRGCVMPRDEQSRSSALYQLVLLIDQWPLYSLDVRISNLGEFVRLLDLVVAAVAPHQPKPRFRADLAG